MSEVAEWESPVAEVTLKNLKSYCEELVEVRVEKDKLNETLDCVHEKIKALEGKILNVMKEHGIPSFKGEFGAISIKNTKSITQPESLDEKLKLFDYLREQGIFEEMVSVNSRTLNSWANKEIEERERKGVFGWVPPGLKPPGEYQSLAVRKK